MTEAVEKPEELTCSSDDKGTVSLLVGAGFGAYGTAVVATSGFVCPVCAIATPLFLGIGAVQRFKYLKNHQGVEGDSPVQDEDVL